MVGRWKVEKVGGGGQWKIFDFSFVSGGRVSREEFLGPTRLQLRLLTAKRVCG